MIHIPCMHIVHTLVFLLLMPHCYIELKIFSHLSQYYSWIKV